MAAGVHVKAVFIIGYRTLSVDIGKNVEQAFGVMSSRPHEFVYGAAAGAASRAARRGADQITARATPTSAALG